MTREQIWLTILTALLVGFTIGGIVTVASLRADLDLLDREVAALGGLQPVNGSGWTPGPEGKSNPREWSAAQPDDPSGRILGITVLSDTLSITVTVCFAGPGDLLYEPPILNGARATYHPTPHTLEQARFDLLSLVTGGQATAVLRFRPVPPQNEKLTLVFNPNQQPGDLVAPRWEMVIRSEGAGME